MSDYTTGRGFTSESELQMPHIVAEHTHPRHNCKYKAGNEARLTQQPHPQQLQCKYKASSEGGLT